MASYLRIGGAPAPSPARVADIRDAMDLSDPALATTFGERARGEVVTLIERLLAETRAGDLGACAPLLGHIEERLHGLNPSALRTRRGMAGWFDSRKKRLKAFRAAFTSASATMAETAGAIGDQGVGVTRRSRALEVLWAETRTAITELDAYVVAGVERLGQDASQDADHPLTGRLASLVVLRNTAIRQLPLVRMTQNADCALPDRLKSLAEAASTWRAAWREGLGLDRKRPRKIVPDQIGLMRDRDALIAVLEGVRRDLSAAATRRAQAMTRMEKVAESVRRAAPKA